MRGFRLPTRYRREVKLFDFSGGVDGSKDDRISPFATAASSFNLRLSDGALKSGYGIGYAAFPTENGSFSPTLPENVYAKRCYFYERFDDEAGKRKDELLVYCSDGYIYSYGLGTNENFKKITSLCFSEPPTGVCYRLSGDDVIIFATDDGLTVYDGKNAESYVAPKMTSVCVHGERLFVTSGTEDTRLWFSQSFDPTNWYVSLKEAGFIDFLDGRGKLQKAISFKDYVYIFRDYGITRLTAYGDQEDFFATGVDADKARIYGDTVADCGKLVFYLTDNGFYYFDGVNSGRIMKGLDKYLEGVDNSSSKACFFDGKYFCSMNIKFDGETMPVTLCFDKNLNSWYLAKGLDYTDFSAVYGAWGSKLLFLVENERKLCELTDDGKFLGNALSFEWRGKTSDFGVDERKTLEKITFYSKKSGKITVKSDEGKREVCFVGDGFKIINVGLKGVEFSVAYSSASPGAYFSKATLSFGFLKGA